jgi:hypothetical protein
MVPNRCSSVTTRQGERARRIRSLSTSRRSSVPSPHVTSARTSASTGMTSLMRWRTSHRHADDHFFLRPKRMAASGFASSPAIYVPENGLISLNVPLVHFAFGATPAQGPRIRSIGRAGKTFWMVSESRRDLKTRTASRRRARCCASHERQKLVRDHASRYHPLAPLGHEVALAWNRTAPVADRVCPA